MHGHMKDVIHMLAKFVAFLQKYIVHEPAAATKYLQANAQILVWAKKSFRKKIGCPFNDNVFQVCDYGYVNLIECVKDNDMSVVSPY